MQDATDLTKLTDRLIETLAQIVSMLGNEQTEERKRQADYMEALRRKAAGELNGNVTAQFFALSA